MSEFTGGSWKHQFNQACTESVRIFKVLELDTLRKKKDTKGFKEAATHIFVCERLTQLCENNVIVDFTS